MERGGGIRYKLDPRNPDWQAVADAVATEKDVIKFLKANDLPTKDARIEISAFGDKIGCKAVCSIDVEWNKNDFKAWVEDHKLPVERLSGTHCIEVDWADKHKNALKLNAFKIKPTYFNSISFFDSEGLRGGEVDELHISFEWNKDVLDPIIDSL